MVGRNHGDALTEPRNRREFFKLAGIALLGAAGAGALGPVPVKAPGLPLELGTRNRDFYDVKAFGAVGDGVADDTRAIQAALDAATASGGGTVFLPAGSYRVSTRRQRGVRNYALLVASNLTLRGAGREVSIIRLANNQRDQARIIANLHGDGSEPGGDSNIIYEDFTIDGNAAYQGIADSQVGISNIYTQNVRHFRIRVRDVKGTAFAEGTHFDNWYSTDNSYTDCEATRTGTGSTATGFSATNCTGIEYKGCRASNMLSFQGFTIMNCRHVQYVDCNSLLNNQRGFNCETSSKVQYVNCLAGGRSTAAGTFPYAGDTPLGNGGDGFYLYRSADVLVSSCVSESNQNGLANVGSQSVRVVGGIFHGNAISGFAFAGPGEATQTRITGGPIVASNGRSAMSIGAQLYPTVFGYMPAPPVPPSGGSVLNPYPFDATVYISGGLVKGVSVHGSNVYGFTNGTVRLAAGQSIQIYHAIPPSWTWFID